jgi:hypothetical protein
MCDGSHNETPADWVVTNANHWVYVGTGLANGSTIPGLIYYEWDSLGDNGATPGGITVMVSSVVPNNIRPGSRHEATIYERQGTAGTALVFAAARFTSTNTCAHNLSPPRWRGTYSPEREQPRISHDAMCEAQRM